MPFGCGENRPCLGDRFTPQPKGIRERRVPHGVPDIFEDPNLLSCAGLALVLQLPERAGLKRLVAEHVHPANPGGVNADLRVPSLVAGMVAGADSIDDMALLRHGAMGRLFDGVRAPSTLGTFLRSFLRPCPTARRGCAPAAGQSGSGRCRCCQGPAIPSNRDGLAGTDTDTSVAMRDSLRR